MTQWMSLYQRLPGLFAFSLGALLALTITAMIFDQRHQGLERSYSQHYGKALANMAAHQAVDASLNHDLISLQVILEDVVNNPRIALATIHDVENNLLVQAGDANTSRKHSRSTHSYSAPIVFHDSVAGYVTVTLYSGSKDRKTVLTTVLIIALLFSGISVLAWYDGSQSLAPESTPLEFVPDEVNSIEPPSLTTSLNNQAIAHIHIDNYAALEQQLTSAKLSKILEQIQQVARDVLVLYNGQQLRTDGHNCRLSFTHAEAQEKAIFNAACGTFLILKIATKTSSVPLQLSGVIATAETQPHSIEAESPSGLFLDQSLSTSSLEASGLIIDQPGDATTGLTAIIGFQQPYASLLENQCEQLLS